MAAALVVKRLRAGHRLEAEVKLGVGAGAGAEVEIEKMFTIREASIHQAAMKVGMSHQNERLRGNAIAEKNGKRRPKHSEDNEPVMHLVLTEHRDVPAATCIFLNRTILVVLKRVATQGELFD